MAKVKIGIVVFPGSNCDHDAHYVADTLLEQEARFIWHKEGSVGDADVVILPGGFSYGDYLRCGAIARFSPVMKDVVRFANAGGVVIGICNGFQVLTEAGLLPGDCCGINPCSLSVNICICEWRMSTQNSQTHASPAKYSTSR